MNLSQSIGTELRSAFDGVFNFHLGNKVKTSQYRMLNEGVDALQKNLYMDWQHFVDVYFGWGENFQISIKQLSVSYKNKGFPHAWFHDLQGKIAYKRGKLRAELNGSNLFNQEKILYQNYSHRSYAEYTYFVQPFRCMLKLNLQF
jgi:outer membrane receptor protein involved in Fe transport